METKIMPFVNPLLIRGIDGVVSLIRGKALKTFDISPLLYKDSAPEVMSKYFKSIPTSLVIDHRSSFEVDQNEIKYVQRAAILSKSNVVDFTFHRHTLIILSMSSMRSNDGSYYEDWMIQCLSNKHDIAMTIDFMKKLNREIRVVGDKTANERFSIVKSANSIITQHNRPIRSWDNVFIPTETETLIRESLHKFANSVNWYREHKIPYHFGILLHGNPGTGKSSVVQAITQEIPCDVCVIPPGELWNALEEGIFTNYRDLYRHQVIIIEDVDTNCFGRESDDNFAMKTQDIGMSPELLGKLLNYMDGYGSPDGTIWILTTNHIDKLDPALVRPGRIDLNIEIGPATDETFKKFMKFHYGYDVPVTYHIRDGMLFGDLQTKVMLGWTPEQILDYSRI